jgi:hypothetical protein
MMLNGAVIRNSGPGLRICVLWVEDMCPLARTNRILAGFLCENIFGSG